MSPVIVQGTLALATAIIDVAGLGFLGLGPQDPSTPEWGTMLTDTTRYLQSAPHLALIPGLAIVISVLGFNLIGDGLREALDPQVQGEGVNEPLLSVEDLEVRFWTSRGIIHAVNGISFDVAPGETLGIVGESGCGKSVTSLAILGILPRAGRVTAGSVRYQGRDLVGLSDDELRTIRGKEIAMIFQDPMTSLNPVLTIGRQLREALETHFDLDKDETHKRAAELLDRVGIPSAKMRLKDYPHQFSGGMRQRAMIAMALACEPKVLIADEPTTALDVTIQAQILGLLRELVAERDTALILITHDLGVVAGMCERVNVMYAGMFMETGSARQVFAQARATRTRSGCCRASRGWTQRGRPHFSRSRAHRATCSFRRTPVRSHRAAATRSSSRARRFRRSSRSSRATRSPASTRCPKTSGSRRARRLVVR